MTRRTNEDGAILILALFFAIAVAVITASLATLAFSSTKASSVYNDRARLVDALDGGIQGAVEDVRLSTTTPQSCPSPAVTLSGASSVNGYQVVVTCTPPSASGGDYSFAATAVCPAVPTDQPMLGIAATAAFSTIGDGPNPPPIARLTSWKVDSQPCTATSPTP